MFQQTPTWARIPRTSDRISGENKKWRDSCMRDYTERHKNIYGTFGVTVIDLRLDLKITSDLGIL